MDKIVPAGARKAVDAAKQVIESRAAATPADIGRVFQPTREIVSPNNRERLIDDPNRTYMNALADLQRAMQRLQDDRASNPDMSLHETARKATDTGLDAVRQIAQRFNIAESQGIDDSMKRLLEAPFRESLKYIITDPIQSHPRQGQRRDADVLRPPDAAAKEIPVPSGLPMSMRPPMR